MNSFDLNTKIEYEVWDKSEESLFNIIRLVGLNNVTFGSTPYADEPSLLVGNTASMNDVVAEGSYVLKTPWGVQIVSGVTMDAFLME